MNVERFKRIDSFIAEKMVQTRLPGLSYALVKDGEVIRRGIGFMDRKRCLAPDSETLFGLGSVTKVFTSLAIMQLHQGKKLDIHDPVERYIDFRIRPCG
ncbi:MAG: serine hydrolase domain-containing protein, partial [Thermaerobacterales bacterium]